MKHLIAEIPGARRVARAFGLMPGLPEHPRFVLEQLPSGSVGVEIGVHRGDYSAEILRVVQPKQLHLIDPWKHEQADDYKDAWFGGRAGGPSDMDRRYRAVCRRGEGRSSGRPPRLFDRRPAHVPGRVARLGLHRRKLFV